MKDSNAQKPIKVMIIGDSLVFRNGLRMLIADEASLQMVGEVAHMSEALKFTDSTKPEVVIINSNEFDRKAADGGLGEFGEGIATLVLTNANDAKIHREYLVSGTNGVVTKEQSSKILFKAIKGVHAGDLWFRRDVMKEAIDYLIKEKEMPSGSVGSDKYALLTDREKEVLGSICAGMKNKVIAETLFITETTVRHHLTSIFEKLNVKSRLALAILAFNEGFIKVPKSTDQINGAMMTEGNGSGKVKHQTNSG